MKKISLLGATGSIGTQTVDIVRAHPEHFELSAISVGRNINEARKIIQQCKPALVSVMKKKIVCHCKQNSLLFDLFMEKKGLWKWQLIHPQKF